MEKFSNSKGEIKISKILSDHNVDFRREFGFQDLTGVKGAPLRFDFAIFKDGKLTALIDFDGIQHFQYTPFFHKTTIAFKRSLEWDRKKNKYCLLRKIPLIRIPYWDLEKLDYEMIFNTPEYIVKDKYHNDKLKELIENGLVTNK